MVVSLGVRWALLSSSHGLSFELNQQQRARLIFTPCCVWDGVEVWAPVSGVDLPRVLVPRQGAILWTPTKEAVFLFGTRFAPTVFFR